MKILTNRRVGLFLSLSLLVVSMATSFSQLNAMEFQEEGDRYKPQTCTAIDKNGESYEKAICELIYLNGPCDTLVKCKDKKVLVVVNNKNHFSLPLLFGKDVKFVGVNKLISYGFIQDKDVLVEYNERILTYNFL
ncbi:hypothetical protein ACV07N_06360 [Roseivirga echinicomitans]